MYYILRDNIINYDGLLACMDHKMIIIDAETFKEILLHSWHLLPKEKQKELIELGIYPQQTVHPN